MININGNTYSCDRYAFDECHKFYLIETDEQENEALNLGYIVRSIEQLPNDFYKSDPLRFIDTWELDSIVPQCETQVEFVVDGQKIKIDFLQDIMEVA